jgi:hypothetical protein
MAQLINEAKRFQKLANIIREAEETPEMTPEEAAKKISNISGEIEKNSKIQQVANKIAADPKAKEELKKILDTYHVSLNEGTPEENLALVFAKKAETIKEDYGGSLLAGLIGGGTLAHYLFSVTTPDFVGGLTHSTAAMPETLAGAAIGAILAIIGRKIYGKTKSIDESLNEAEIQSLDRQSMIKDIIIPALRSGSEVVIGGETIAPTAGSFIIGAKMSKANNEVTIDGEPVEKIIRTTSVDLGRPTTMADIDMEDAIKSSGNYVYPPGSRMDEIREDEIVTFKKSGTYHLGKIDGKDYQIKPVNHIVGDKIKATNWDDSSDFLIGIIDSIDGDNYEVKMTSDKNLEEIVNEALKKFRKGK